ncbi:hypothetical protein N7540_005511 [Penicillium herquei]|nr:hypothetical protein N7540_005511 [Penicillium herquei]
MTYRLLNTILAASLFIFPGAAHYPTQNTSIETLFGPYLSPGAEIASSANTNFSSVVTARWTSWNAPTWIGAIKPATENDVQEIVKIASANGISFLATNGGHGAGIGYANVSGIDINLSNFNIFSIDVDRNELTLGAGVLIGDLIQPLYDAGLAVPHGNEGCVGMIGATLGGGIGIGTGVLGLGVDSLKSVRLVTAAGNLVTASSKSHPGLFWAIRGAGANFGIILSATFELQNQINDGNTVHGSFTFSGADNSSVFELYKSFDENLPDELAITLGLSYNQTSETSEIILNYYCFWPQSEAQPYLDAVQALKPLTSSVSVLTAPELYQGLENGECTTGASLSGGTLGISETDIPTLQAVFAEFVEFSQVNAKTYIGQSVFQRYSNSRAVQISSCSTSYPWRDIKTFWLHLNVFLSPELEDASTNFTLSMRSKLQATSGFSSPHIYVNYAYGDEGPSAWWSAANLPKLRVLKALWDPKHLFGVTNPIPALP